MIYVGIFVNKVFIFSVFVLTVFQSRFLREDKVVFFSDVVLFEYLHLFFFLVLVLVSLCLGVWYFGHYYLALDFALKFLLLLHLTFSFLYSGPVDMCLYIFIDPFPIY